MRGQAFDTFKLMIAAVVAVAILGILLGILGGISTPGQGFTPTAKQLITQATQNPGQTFPSAGEVNFKKDSIIPAKVFQTASGGKPVKFIVNNSLKNLCSNTGDSLRINNHFNSRIYACCGDFSTGCEIGISAVVTC